MTQLMIVLAVVNLALLVLGAVYFQPLRRFCGHRIGSDAATVESDAEKSVALFKAIHQALSTHAGDLASAPQHSDSGEQESQPPASWPVDRIRESNRETQQTLEDNNEQLESLLGTYGDLYHTERQRIESYAQSVADLDELLEKYQDQAESSNRLLLQLVRDMIRENRSLQNKVFDCQEQVSELIVRSVKSERDARTDALTQIENRRAWDERLSTLDYPMSIALVDVDDFKQINDRFGHPAGDAMLTLIGTLLRNSGEVAPYRIGGDEFALLIPPGSEEAIAGRISKKINAAVLRFAGEQLSVSVSMGVASSRDGQSPRATLVRADDALYEAKKFKGNREQSIQFA